MMRPAKLKKSIADTDTQYTDSDVSYTQSLSREDSIEYNLI